jgi:type III pantothenate kinase
MDLMSAPLMAFDIGNTSVKAARFADGQWALLARVPTEPVGSLAARLSHALAGARTDGPADDRWVVSSVHPAACAQVVRLPTCSGRPPAEAFGTDLPVPIDMHVVEPSRVGMDRVLAALGAREHSGAPCVAVAAGTAITVDLVDPAGRFAGGAIMPGLRVAGRALHEQTALLPEVRVEGVPEDGPGADTRSALARGVYWACAGGVLAVVHSYLRGLGGAATPVVCTGSDAPLLIPALADLALTHDPLLVFRGMSAALRDRG